MTDSERRKAVQCTITILEVDGKLDIMANIPDGAENTFAAVLTKALFDGLANITDEGLGESQKVEMFRSN